MMGFLFYKRRVPQSQMLISFVAIILSQGSLTNLVWRLNTTNPKFSTSPEPQEIITPNLLT